jgi:pyruvate kinase
MIPKKVKIIATLGPSSDNPEIIYKLADAGVNIFRINLSHASEREIENRIQWVRDAEEKLQKPIGILGDLAGPKIRIGEIEEDVTIQKDQEITIVKDEITGNKHIFSLNHPSIVAKLKNNTEIFIDDGKIKLKVIKESDTNVIARVLAGGPLKSRKGFSAQGISLASQGLSLKDKNDLNFVLDKGVDFIAISFVQTEEDIKVVRQLLPANSSIMLIAKIETMKGIEEIEKIIKAADGIMVARGDLGLAVPMEEIPYLQKRIIAMCLQESKPAITATQMLESMTVNPIPTRAEVTDVANAILDGTDAVMLSGETALGNFPVETVEMMARIIRKTTPHIVTLNYENEHNKAHVVSSAVGSIANKLDAKIIVAFTESGNTARSIARYRNPQVIFALTPNKSTWRVLNLTAGVYTFLIEPTRDLDHMIEQVKYFVQNNKILPLEKNDSIVIVAGMPFGMSGATNMIYVERV